MAGNDGQPAEVAISLTPARRRRRAEKQAGAGTGPAEEIGPNDIIVHPGDLPKTAREVRERLAKPPELFQRSGAPVRVYIDLDDRLDMVTLTEFDIVNLVHTNFRVRQWHVPKDGSDGKLVPVTLPQRVARLYLVMIGYFELRPLRGITETPLRSDDGTILTGAA